MAEDTRLAEACLLLNYSSQSYREQMLLNKNLQNNMSDNTACNQQTSERINCEIKFETHEQQQQQPQQTSDPFQQIIPPSENKVCSNIIDNPSFFEQDRTDIQDRDEEIFTSDQIKREPIEGETTFDKIHPTLSTTAPAMATTTPLPAAAIAVPSRIPDDCYLSKYNKNPINNLLAAVNCALPGIKNRPNILQRTTSNPHQHNMINNHRKPFKSSTGTLSIPDHDYCQPDDTLSPSAYHSDGFIDVIKHHNEHRNQHQHYADQYSNSSEQQQQLKFDQNQRPKRDAIDNLKGTISKRKQKHSSSLGSLNNSLKNPLKLVAIHLGAGNSHNEFEALPLAKSICEEVMLQTSTANADPSRQSLSYKKKRNKTSSFHLKSQDNLAQTSECKHHRKFDDQNEILNSETAVVRLIKLMEDNQLLNCGYGSNLNIKGQVECDSSLMSDRTQMWTGVGAVSGCKNPILLAKSLYDHRTIPRPLGLIQPNILVGSGAKQWMREHCPYLSLMDSKMIGPKSFSAYQKFKSKYDLALKSLKQSQSEGEMILNSGGINQDYSHVANETMNNVTSSFCKPPSADGSSASFTTTTINDLKSHTTSSTALDHGFYCITTRDNLRRASSFARIDERMERKKCFKTRTTSKIPQYQTDVQIGIEFQEHTCYHNNSRLDTVGAVAVDCDNNFASAISSGGLLLKYKGRVGQAAIPGAGCWSENSVAVTTTGVGEYLTLNLFAKKFYDKIVTLRLLYDLGHVEKGSSATSAKTTASISCNEDLSNLISCAMEECFEELIRSPALAHVPVQERLAGMLAVNTINSKDSPKRVDDSGDLYMSFGHNTQSMCVGYMTCNDIVAHSFMSKQQQRKLNDEKDNCKVTVKTIKFSLDPDKYVDNYASNCSTSTGDIRNNNKISENTTRIIKIETDSMNQSA